MVTTEQIAALRRSAQLDNRIMGAPGSGVREHAGWTLAALDELEASRVASSAGQKHGREHCPTCICGKRAPVMADCSKLGRGRGPGTIAWAEHLHAWSGYDAEYRSGPSAQRLAERGGFSYGELVTFLGHEPETWEPER